MSERVRLRLLRPEEAIRPPQGREARLSARFQCRKLAVLSQNFTIFARFLVKSGKIRRKTGIAFDWDFF